MKVAKLVSGIISIVLCPLVLFQSCAAGVGNAMAENGEVSGSAGLFVAICLIVAGIVGPGHQEFRRQGCFHHHRRVLHHGALLGFANAGSYSDLNIWAAVCVIFAILYIVAAVKAKKPEAKADQSEQ